MIFKSREDNNKNNEDDDNLFYPDTAYIDTEGNTIELMETVLFNDQAPKTKKLKIHNFGDDKKSLSKNLRKAIYYLIDDEIITEKKLGEDNP